MSGERGRRGWAGALGHRGRLIVILALAGAATGFLWGVADEPRYTATATLLVGGPNGGEAEPAELARYAELGASDRVAVESAGLLGDDVAGADLLSDVGVEPGADGVTLDVAATSELPDFAAATAEAFAEALIVITDDALRERLRSKRSALDPDSEEAIALDGRISELRTAGVGGPLSAGASAQIPTTPSENRSALAWAAGGLGAGLILGVLLALLTGRSKSPSARRERVEEPRMVAPLTAAFGTPLLGRFNDPGGAVVAIGPGAIHLDAEDLPSFRRIADAIGLDSPDAPRTLAFVDVSARDGAHAIGMGVAIAAAEMGLNVVVVEADLSTPSLAAGTRVDGAPGLRDYLDGTANPREVLRRVHAEIGEGESVSLVCVPAGEPIDGAPRTIAGPRFEGLTERLPRVYDLVLFECPPLLADDDAALVARLVDGVVLVATEEEASRSGIERSVAMLAPEPLLGGVLIGARNPRADDA